MVSLTSNLETKNLLQEAFLDVILQKIKFYSDINNYLFSLRYHPNHQAKKLIEIAKKITKKFPDFNESCINMFAARVNDKILQVFKEEMEQDGIDVDSILNNSDRGKPQNGIAPYQVTYQWLWEKKFPRMGWKLAKGVALPARDKLTMLDINQNFQLEKSDDKRASRLSFRGLRIDHTIIKQPDNYIYLEKPYHLQLNLPNDGKYLLLINEAVEGNFCLLSPSVAFAYVPHTKLSEGLRLPPSEGLAKFFQYDAVGDEYFLAIVTEQPIDLSWINWESDPTDVILSQERLGEIFIKLGQQGNSEVFYKRFKVVEKPINHSDQSATIINNKNLVYQGG